MFRTREKARILTWFFGRSWLPFAIEFLLLAPLVLGLNVPGIEPLYLIVSQWLLLAIGLLNVPFVSAAFRAFRMDRATRRNHALEHRVGDWIQGRFFMATDFREISVRDIRKVTPIRDERPPVYFVETTIRVEPSPASTTPPPASATAAS